MIVIPAIDIHAGRCIRMTQDGTKPEAVYGDDPVKMARRWSHQGARWLHVIDFEGLSARRPVQLELVAAIAVVGVAVQVGGGFRTLKDLEEGLATGAARVLMETAALDTAREAGRRFGERVAALLAVRDGRVTVDEGPEDASADPISLGKALAASGIRRIVYTDLTRDGTLAGPDIPALGDFVRAVAVPVIAAGGITSLADLTALARIGMEAVVVGRALHEGWLDLRGLEQRLHSAQENRRA